MRCVVVALLLSLGAVLPLACDDPTQKDTTSQPSEDLAVSQDIIEDPTGYQGLETLCPVIEACNFGFTVESCQAEFLNYCTIESAKSTYLDCMKECHAAYQGSPNCDTFRNCESGCWGDSGCAEPI